MNAAINQDTLVKPAATNPLHLPGLQQVYYNLTYLKVINELKAPKGHVNKFADGYKYRSAEDIQEALKPILLKHKCTVITRKFDTAGGFEIYAYMVFKDQTYICCELPGVAECDFERDLGANKKNNRTQQYAAYQSYAKKYALGNLLQIDDSQNDLDAIDDRNQKNPVATQADCDLALKQIEDMPLDISLDQAVKQFDQIVRAYPTFYEVLNNACCKKHAEIEQHLYAMQNTQQDAVAFNTNANTNTQPKNTTGAKSQPSVQQQHNAPPLSPDAGPALVTKKQHDDLVAFIDQRGLRMKDVCSYMGIDSLMQICANNINETKADIEKMANEELRG